MATGGSTATTDLQFDQSAYQLAVDYSFRPQNFHDQIASVMPDAQSFPGKAVIFPFVGDLPIQSTSIDESTDVTPQVLSDSTVTVTLAEYGAAVRTTAFVRGTSYVAPFDPIVANVIGYNAAASIDVIARNVLVGGTQVAYATGTGAAPAGRTSVTPLNTLRATDVRAATAFLRRNNTPTIGGYYVSYIHPDVSVDLRTETTGAPWRDPHIYNDPGNIYVGEIGAFEGVRFIEAPRARIFADAGSSTTNTDVYATLFLGAQALAKAYSFTDGNGASPKVFPGPITDMLRRFVPIGWYWLGGYKIYRDAAGVGYSLYRVESSASGAQNSATGSNNPTNNANG